MGVAEPCFDAIFLAEQIMPAELRAIIERHGLAILRRETFQQSPQIVSDGLGCFRFLTQENGQPRFSLMRDQQEIPRFREAHQVRLPMAEVHTPVDR